MQAIPALFLPRSWTAGFTQLILVAGAITATAPGLTAQQACVERSEWGSRERHCEGRELSMASTGALDIDGGQNGGITVVGGGGADVRVVAEVWAVARDLDQAERLAGEVRIRSEGNRLKAVGPSTRDREAWGVNWRVEVPSDMDLDLNTHNGGIRVEDVSGRLRFDALNGGVALRGLAGDVVGKTTNGGLSIELDGRAWAGRGMDVSTTNGGVEVVIPDGYSADFETGTVNGRMDFGIPITVRGRIDRQIRTQLGEGGSPVRAVTTNGGVRIRSTH